MTIEQTESHDLLRRRDDLRREVAALTETRDRLRSGDGAPTGPKGSTAVDVDLEQVSIPTAATGVAPPSRENLYVFEEDDEEARAFDEFYRAYDEVHAKTRKFLLG